MKKVIIGVLVLFIAGLCFLNLLGDGGKKSMRYIVIGDGRAGELKEFVDEAAVEFVTKSGADVDWLDKEALPDAAKTADSYTVICVMTGISDMDHADLYVERLNKWGKRLSEENSAMLCFNSVNPVTTGVFNPSDVEDFNEAVENGLSDDVYYIDTYSAMMEAGFETTDSLHYTKESSELLARNLMTELNKLHEES
jgi:hypothetical protein